MQVFGSWLLPPEPGYVAVQFAYFTRGPGPGANRVGSPGLVQLAELGSWAQGYIHQRNIIF